MATATLALEQWQAEYYETMAAGGKVRLAVARELNFLKVLGIACRLFSVVHDEKKLIALLAKLETYPSSVLLEDEARDIPSSLRRLFQGTCVMLERAQEKGLDRNFLTKNSLTHLESLNQEISSFADRYDDALQKLATRVPQEHVDEYRSALEAYATCELKADPSNEEDLKTKLLHF